VGRLAHPAGYLNRDAEDLKYGGEALYFRDPDGHLLEVVTPGVWNIY